MDNETTAIVVLLSISSVLVTLINMLCIYVIFHSNKLLKKPPTILITNLIGTHMIQGVFVIPTYALRKANIDAGLSVEKFLCDSFRFTYMLTFYLATISVLLLSVDRLLAVKLLNRYDKTVTRKRAAIVTIVAWIYIFLLCILPFIPFKRSTALAKSKCSYNHPSEWTIFMLLVNSLIPYIIVIICYKQVEKKLSSLHEYFVKTTITDSGDEIPSVKRKREREQRKTSYNTKITKLTFLIILSYGITWAPSIIYFLCQHIFPGMFHEDYYGSKTERRLSFLMKYINFFDAIGAPVLYCYYHDEFKLEFKRIVLKRKIVHFTTMESSNHDNNNVVNVCMK